MVILILKIVLAVLTTIVPIGIYLWKRKYSIKAKIRRLKKRLDEIEKEQNAALEVDNMSRYYELATERMLTNKEINNLR